MYKKKISDMQFCLDCINKEFEIIGSSLHWETFDELCSWANLPENRHWFSDNAFTSREQYDQWKAYFMEHYYDWQPRHKSKRAVELEFSWFALQYGLRYDFEDKPAGTYV